MNKSTRAWLTAMCLGLTSLLLHSCANKPVPEQANTGAKDCVILLHGLARSSESMEPMAERLLTQHYRVINVDYHSRQFAIAQLAEIAIPPALASCREQPTERIHFVTHSLGGILVRQYLSKHSVAELDHVVMLAPPNKGSEIVDHLGDLPPFEWLNGPAGKELGTHADSLPNRLGPVNFDVGVIAGTSSVNLLLSLYLPNPDDGKVSVESTKIDGMHDFISLPVSHPFIMKDEDVIEQIIYYLRNGHFAHPPVVVDHKEP